MRRRTLVLVLAVTLMSATVSPVMAESDAAERIPVYYTTSGTAFADGHQTQQGQMLIGTGDGTLVFADDDQLAGAASFTIHYRWNRETKGGNGHGTLDITPTIYPNSGWTGTFNTKYADMLFFEIPGVGTFPLAYNSTTESILHGYGVFEGMILRTNDTVRIGDPIRSGEGEILVPASVSVP